MGPSPVKSRHTSVLEAGDIDINWREGETLVPVDGVIASRAAKLYQCLPEGRLEVVEVGEKGELGPI